MVRAAQDGLTSRLAADLARHAAFGQKYSGGQGDIATANWVAERLRAAGCQVAQPTFQAPFFVKRAARLTAGAASVEVFPQAPVVPTAARGITAPLALVEGAVQEVRGRIALIVAPFARHAALFPASGIGATVRAAAEAGAVAIVLVTTGPSGAVIALNAPAQEPFVRVPMALLAPNQAAQFIAAARAGASATLVLDGEATHRASQNVIARLERGCKWLVISTPRSGWFDCVGERGTGTAAFFELITWVRGRFRDVSIFLMNSGGHEYFFEGSKHVLHEAPPPEQTLAWIHLGATLAARDAEAREGQLVMLDTVDPGRSLMATAGARAAAVDAFRGLVGLENPAEVRPQAGELSTFTDLGYANALAVIGQLSWFHTTSDTLERVDAGLLAPVVRAHQRAIELLVGAG